MKENKPITLLAFVLSICILALMAVNYFSTDTKAQSTLSPIETIKQNTFTKLINSADKTGSAMVIVGIDTEFIPDGNLSKYESAKQHQQIRNRQTNLLQRYQSANLKNVKQFEYIPYIAFEADAITLRSMQNDDLITNIQEDEIAEASLAESTAMVGANAAWASGYSGSGQTVAILDSGVDKNHTFLNGRVISEACYSSNTVNSTSVCPGGATESTASDSGLNCPVTVDGCAHGTHVAGIAAGRGTSFSGVAKDANIIAIQMFSQFSGVAGCPTTFCARYFTSDLIRALERVRTLANTMNNIVAVNLSLQTGQQFVSNCDAVHAATKAAIDNLRSVNIATIICAGNYSFTNALTAPACISTSISVGSIDDGSLGTIQWQVSSFSDSSPLLHLLAPGRWINSSIPGNAYSNYSGTSMATPHVVGAFAVLRQRKPNATINQVLAALTNTGQPVTDTRNGIIKPLIKIDKALAAIVKSNIDFDGDTKTDISIYRPTLGQWWYLRSSDNANRAFQFGSPTDKIVPADYTGDGKTDIATFTPSTGFWSILRSEDSTYYAFPFGTNGDIPAPGDYDGDGKADAAVFRPSAATWYISKSSGGTIIQQFGAIGDVPTVGDYDGDGKVDLAIYRVALGEWWYLRSSDGTNRAFTFGTATDKPVQGDYTGDGKTDVAFYRPTTGQWFILRSEDSSFYAFPFGTLGDIPSPGDYDGDGKFDAAVFRPSAATWYLNRSTAGIGIVGFGANGDLPVPSAFVP
jgi:subtilisin